MAKLKVKENQIEIIEKDEQFWTTSLDVAEKFGKRHKNVLRDIKNLECQDKDFTRLNFEPSTRQTAAGEQEYYIISRDGFSLLAMGFTGKEALQWKIKYIAAFNQMEKTIIAQAKQLRREANREWKQLREDGKVARRVGTDALKNFREYAESQGSQNAYWYYKAGTCAVYDACVEGGWKEVQRRLKESGKKNGRDVLTPQELVNITLLDSVFLPRTVKDIRETKEEYHNGFKILKSKLADYNLLINSKLLSTVGCKPIVLTVPKD